jgi:hypothetical protein
MVYCSLAIVLVHFYCQYYNIFGAPRMTEAQQAESGDYFLELYKVYTTQPTA